MPISRVRRETEYAITPGADAKELKIVAGDDLAERQPRAIAGADRGEHRTVAGDVREDRVLGAEVEQIGVQRGVPRVAVAAGRVDVDELVGRAYRQRPEEDSVDDAEERRVETDPDRKGCDRRQGETWAAAKPAQGVAEVVRREGYDTPARRFGGTAAVDGLKTIGRAREGDQTD
ncbi:MAG: hypothetical protein ACRD09_11255 [Vicinamibacterales bacterium]